MVSFTNEHPFNLRKRGPEPVCNECARFHPNALTSAINTVLLPGTYQCTLCRDWTYYRRHRKRKRTRADARLDAPSADSRGVLLERCWCVPLGDAALVQDENAVAAQDDWMHLSVWGSIDHVASSKTSTLAVVQSALAKQLPLADAPAGGALVDRFVQ
ncbi:hypothetical protein SPRG_15138 [Saprolegnia parasitica CBS 223.65]|uniref:Uncharacterized protein n=1 Tax=Saprolegnia parasitica (strain CBS 223.65) TaxID=695850 RepID=A0A067BXU6_SAPPC|nr:hypothetical protein SPRG_15138 [Saprolegnia parasitica CBS 223.65]KDO19397.1 hypothetical protein SPRG_15138 [Saprolegnia parasitica CBS 223.65]|eukprot:XP_012209901.1 hypothetical protein SPRG_15138 [Saprolegnia parasitica CBS 223.65]